MLVLLELLFFHFFVSSFASVSISMSDGDLCEGAVANWTCVVNGSSLGWRNLGETAFPTSSVLVDLGPGSPFSSTLISFIGGIATSEATANLTTSVNQSLLECSDGDFDLAITTITNVTLLLNESSPANHISTTPIIRNSLDISIVVRWGGATCVPMYRISQGGGAPFDINTNEYTFVVPPGANDNYMFSVSSYNYFGQIVDGIPLVANVCVSTPIVTASSEYMMDDNTISILIVDASVCTVPGTSCSISLTNGSSYNEMMPCTLGKMVEFTEITIGRQYTYNITTNNMFRSSNLIGTVVIPELLAVTTTFTLTETARATGSSKPSFSHISPLSGIIIGVILFLLLFLGLYIVLILCRISRCFCPKFWDNRFWSIFFCDCFKGTENETKTMPFKRSESPEVVKQTVSEM